MVFCRCGDVWINAGVIDRPPLATGFSRASIVHPGCLSPSQVITLLTCALWIGASPCFGAITATGATTVAVRSTDSTYAGNGGVGSLTIDAGSSLTNAYGYVGYGSNGNGTATVRGLGSKWINTTLIFVGHDASGVLRVESGAQVTSGSAILGSEGYPYRGNGSVTVTGSGSTWTITNDLDVVQGSLTVEDGGLLTVQQLRASLSRMYGNGTIAIQGGVIDADLIFDATHGPTQTLSFGNGGSLNLSIGSSSTLGVGYREGGTLRVADGVDLISAYGYVGSTNALTTTATVTGPGTSWVIANDLSIASGTTTSASGTLIIDSGAEVRCRSGLIGATSASTGVAIVRGTGSKWVNASELNVGVAGQSSLTVEAGGYVSCIDGTVGKGGGGTALISGSGSTWVSSGCLTIGKEKRSTLIVDAGGQVTSSSSYIGYGANSYGEVTVSGAGSRWTNNGPMYLSYDGVGVLTVASGGVVATRVVYANPICLRGNGTVSAAGAVLDSWLEFAGSDCTTAVVPFGNSTGCLYVTPDGTQVIGAGYQGTGSLSITEGAKVTSSSGCLGYRSTASRGSATVSGTGSKWTITGKIVIGNAGEGSLAIESGGMLSDAGGSIGYLTGSTGDAIVTGSGSRWTHSSDFTIGDGWGTGSLLVDSGGSVSYTRATIGQSSGTVTVCGVGSNWTDTLGVTVGSKGTGTLKIEDGAVMTSAIASIGPVSGSSGTVSVTGQGSIWNIAGSLQVGGNGIGKLTVADGAIVNAKTLYAPPNSLLGDSTINLSGGVLLSGNTVFDGSHGITAGIPFGSGGIIKLPATGCIEFGVGYRGSGSLRIADGVVLSSTYGYVGYETGGSGVVTVTGSGSKWVNALLYVGYNGGSGTLDVTAGGSVSTSSLTNKGSINIAPGSSLAIAGNFSQSAGSTIVAGMMEIGAVSNPMLITGGTVQIGNGVDAGTLLTRAVTITGGTVKFNHSGTTTFAGGFDGSGSLMHVGPGTTILTAGDSLLTGPVTINAGTLQLEGSFTKATATVMGATSKLAINANCAVNGVVVNSGSIEVGKVDNAGGAKSFKTKSLTLSSGGLVQLHQGALVVDYTGTSPQATIKAALVLGYHMGDWVGGIGGSITSSAATAMPAKYAVGYGEASEVLASSFSGGITSVNWWGQNVDATSLLVRLTLSADATLDGRVDFDDLLKLAQNYGASGSGIGWSRGDFTYDGKVDFDDLLLLAQSYNAALGGTSQIIEAGSVTIDLSNLNGPSNFAVEWQAALATGVPEPSFVAMLALGILALESRRRLDRGDGRVASFEGCSRGARRPLA